MRKCRTLLALLTGLLYAATGQAFDSSIRFDYTIYLHINSTPPGATLYSVAKEEADEPKEIGITPMVMAIGLDWDRVFWQRSWRTLHVTSAENCCEAILNADNTYDILFTCDITKPGYYPQEYAQSVVSLKHPGYTWDGTKDWPQDVYITLELSKMPTPTSPPPKSVPSMILASGREAVGADMGELQVRSYPDNARIYIDGKHVGVTPLDIHIPEGRYEVRLKQRGYRDIEQAVVISPPAKETIDVIMDVRKELPGP